MQAYRLHSGRGLDSLERVDVPAPALPAQGVRLRLRAVALNYRDLMIAGGSYRLAPEGPLVPCSDGAGEVVEVGPEVTRFRPGDRVAASFFLRWIDGPPTPEKLVESLGGGGVGLLAEEVVLPEAALVAVPPHLDFAEAACLPCAGVTAWNALFVVGALRPGASVLLLGTGGVSIAALQLAEAAGLRSLVTSSSDDKLARARALGAAVTVNYRTTPEWQEVVLEETGGRGVDLVVEVGGEATLARSVAATRLGGTLAVIGGLGGFGAELGPMPLIGGAKRLEGILVGSRAMLEELSRFVGLTGLRPVVDRVFPFAEAREAFRHLEAAGHFGKVVIAVGD